jgi:two-component system nitrogen regulation sensor histidine kinase NtrY
MVFPVAESDPAAFNAPSRRSRGAIGFSIGFALAAILTVMATIFAVSGGGLGPASPLIAVLLGASLLICLVLAAILGHRIARIVRASSGTAVGAKLHLRFASLFSLAAVTPALIVALFLGAAFSQGVEQWFSTRVRTVVENAADVGRSYVDGATADLSGEVLAMAEDLNLARGALTNDAGRYGSFLVAQAQRRSLSSAYVLDRTGHVMARAEDATAPAYAPPSPQAYDEAGAGAVWIRFDENANQMRALYKLRAYRDGFLYVARPLDPGMVSRLRNFESAVIAYRDAESSRGKLQALFGASYFSVALLVLLGAVWVGLSNASRISEPIGRLAFAARSVASGDFTTRVPIGAERDEVDALAAAFNQMTAQLEAQRHDLVDAQEQAERRSRFIQAVLSGVSAGVVGLDRDGRISAANRSAPALLGQDGGDLIGRRLVDVAPELAELLNRPTPHGQTKPERVDIVRENFSVNLSVRMSPDPEGGALILTFDDMTKLIAAQRQEAWKDVARRIAHEIRNPLTPIQLSAERLRRKYSDEIKSDPETFLRCTDTILRQVADIGRMVDEFSSFARMPTPRMAFADMSEIARSAVFSQRLVFPDLRFDLEGVDNPIGLVCDERLIAQALLNLVKNAAESVHARRQRDGEPKEGFVRVKLRDLEYGVQFEVIDNGFGFPAQERERQRLIEPYVTTRTKGTGLGLAIVARVIEDHGGLIELDDAPGQEVGAVVRFVLPKRGEDTNEGPIEVGQGAV